MRKRYPSTYQGGAFWLAFLHALSLHPRALLASFPDLNRLTCGAVELLGQAGMQRTGLALLALAAWVALQPSEGEWPAGYLSLQGKEGGCLPRWSWKE